MGNDIIGILSVYFERYGYWTLAGVLRMHWRRFAVFNALGATAWVTSMASLGYLFGRQWQKLVPLLRNANLVLLAVIGLLLIGAWWRHRRETS